METTVSKETILLVDDNDAVRHAAARLLQRNGYRIIEATDGAEALEIAKDRATDVDLVITDVMMPKLGGRALYDALQQLPHPPRFLFCSGYLQPEELDGIDQDGEVPFLSKPWNAADLAAAVQHALGGDGQGGGAPTPPR